MGLGNQTLVRRMFISLHTCFPPAFSNPPTLQLEKVSHRMVLPLANLFIDFGQGLITKNPFTRVFPCLGGRAVMMEKTETVAGELPQLLESLRTKSSCDRFSTSSGV